MTLWCLPLYSVKWRKSECITRTVSWMPGPIRDSEDRDKMGFYPGGKKDGVATGWPPRHTGMWAWPQWTDRIADFIPAVNTCALRKAKLKGSLMLQNVFGGKRGESGVRGEECNKCNPHPRPHHLTSPQSLDFWSRRGDMRAEEALVLLHSPHYTVQ
jgi:hypothetical protein